jgi:hypothetical protein
MKSHATVTALKTTIALIAAATGAVLLSGTASAATPTPATDHRRAHNGAGQRAAVAGATRTSVPRASGRTANAYSSPTTTATPAPTVGTAADAGTATFVGSTGTDLPESGGGTGPNPACRRISGRKTPPLTALKPSHTGLAITANPFHNRGDHQPHPPGVANTGQETTLLSASPATPRGLITKETLHVRSRATPTPSSSLPMDHRRARRSRSAHHGRLRTQHWHFRALVVELAHRPWAGHAGLPAMHDPTRSDFPRPTQHRRWYHTEHHSRRRNRTPPTRHAPTRGKPTDLERGPHRVRQSGSASHPRAKYPRFLAEAQYRAPLRMPGPGAPGHRDHLGRDPRHLALSAVRGAVSSRRRRHG